MRVEIPPIGLDSKIVAVLPKNVASSLQKSPEGAKAAIGCASCIAAQIYEHAKSLEISVTDLPGDAAEVTFVCAQGFLMMNPPDKGHGLESGRSRLPCSDIKPFDVYVVPQEITSQMQLHPLHGL